jgi:tetratricopeptide (TPR) repeat protein
MGRYKEALQAFDKAIELQPNYAGAWAHKGETLQKMERYKEAEQVLQKALEIDPEYSYARERLGLTYYLEQKTCLSLATFVQMVEHEPDDPLAHNNIGFILTGMGKYDEAMSELLQAVGLGFHAPSIVYANLGHLCLKLREYDRASTFLRKSIELFNEDDGTAILRIAFYHKKYAELAREDPFPTDFVPIKTASYCNLATVLAEQGMLEQAVEACRDAINSSPQSALGYRALGHIHLEMGDLEKALQAFTETLELEEDNQEILRVVAFVKSLIPQK